MSTNRTDFVLLRICETPSTCEFSVCASGRVKETNVAAGVCVGAISVYVRILVLPHSLVQEKLCLDLCVEIPLHLKVLCMQMAQSVRLRRLVKRPRR